MSLRLKLLAVVRGFSLLELLIAMAFLAVVLVLSASMIGSIQEVWKKSSARTEQMRTARQALETMASRLSQATLNPYWVIETNSAGRPVRYARQSDLRFFSSVATPTASSQRGSAIFFQAPTGFFTNSAAVLDSSLNTWGYFVEYGPDSDYPNFRPSILPASSIKNRYRLIEFLDPSDNLRIFTDTSGAPNYTGTNWFSVPLAVATNKRVLAENVVAVVALPRLPSVEDPTGVALAPTYTYNSVQSNSVALVNPRHQLPPIVDLAVVAISESSLRRIDWGASPPSILTSDLFSQAIDMEKDLNTLRERIEEKGLKAEIFRTSVPIAAARWSTEQKD